jgi:hypothetical protein
MEMLPHWLLFLFLLSKGACALRCPSECSCNDEYQAISITKCSTSNLTATASNLDENTTHLHIVYEKFKSLPGEVEDPDFSHLENLQAILLDHNLQYSYPQVDLKRSSFARPSQLRIFMSRLRLKFTTDTFADMPVMEQLALSNTAMNWSDFPQIMKQSLCTMQNLTVLDLSGFSVELGTSKLQEKFDPRAVFEGCTIGSVKKLHLRNNDISKYTPEFNLPFPNVMVLDLSYNVLLTTDYWLDRETAKEFLKLLFFRRLHTLDFSNQMTKLPDIPFNSARLLGEVDIPNISSSCNFANNFYWVAKLASSYPYNWTVDIFENLCTTVEKVVLNSLHGSPNINLLVIDNRLLISHFAKFLFRVSSRIFYVDLSDNAFLKFVRSENIYFAAKLDFLEYLNLQENKIKAFHPLFFTQAPSLTSY